MPTSADVGEDCEVFRCGGIHCLAEVHAIEGHGGLVFGAQRRTETDEVPTRNLRQVRCRVLDFQIE